MAGTYIQLIFDIMVFKLAFHTYEALDNKIKVLDKRRKDNYESYGEVDYGKPQNNPYAGGSLDTNENLDDDLDLISNMSDESTMTMSGPVHVRERKLEKINESLDIKLNTFLMKWIIIIIFYQTSFIWTFLGFFLPAMPAIQLAICGWITLPQLKGEFFCYHMIIGWILYGEKRLIQLRIDAASKIVHYTNTLALETLKLFINYISEEKITET